ncbi:NuoM family protein [Acidicapsa dinghuensis]|uniref:NuoM family protein n=1 Tax=Acidicapsa dinghuensis TaxID=2218256 RepID=A0ABW1EI18_9BACT|nr:NADH-quinone oxidoreductase subunit M [Acidicapsa dinghuensis]
MTHVLSILTAIPAIGAVIALLAGNRSTTARAVAFVAGAVSLLVTLWVWFSLAPNGVMSFVERADWVPGLGIEYHLGVDGLGALMLVLSAIVSVMAIAASRKVAQQPGVYFALILLLESGLFGTFTALNFFHWFLFWELSLIPAFFLIKLWGGEGRGKAATQFFVYTMVGSVTLLLAFLALYLATGSMDFETLTAMAASGQLVPAVQAHLGPVSLVLALGVLLGFAVKVPLMPFHTWLPATYSKAPSPVTMLLTGAMSKMGVYGLLRLALPIFGAQLAEIRTPLLALATLTVVAGAWAAAVQKDLKRVFAYSSINHLGYCLLALFAVALPASASPSVLTQTAALDGVILQMFNHGITAAAIFWFLTMIEERSGGVLGLNDFGGLRKLAPVFCGLMGIALFSSLGLPGLNGFVSEFLIFRGVFPLSWLSATIAVLGLLITAAVILTVIQRVFTGPVNPRWQAFADLSTGERVAVAPILILMAVLGLYPQVVLGTVNATVTHLLAGWRF